jgi:hypothetical protein
MAAAQVLKHAISSPQRAGNVCANTDDSLSNGLVVEEGVELDHSVHVRKWDS